MIFGQCVLSRARAQSILHRTGCLLVGGMIALSCAPSEEQRVRGWPRDTVVTVTTVTEDEVAMNRLMGPVRGRASQPLPGELALNADAASASDDVSPPQTDGCQALVKQVCADLGPHGDECAHLRAKVRLEQGLGQDALCHRLLTEFAVDERSLRRVCAQLVRAVCKVEGARSRACIDTRAHVRSLVTEEQRRGCRGDLLWLRWRLASGAATRLESER